MGLGGLTRDSIIGLNNLVAHDEEDRSFHNNCTYTGADNQRSLLNNESGNGSDDFLFLDEDDSLTANASESLFETSLNDGIATLAPPSQIGDYRPTPYGNVSATNSRSLDSYRTNTPGQSTSDSHHQGFQYEGYTDYYSEDFASYDSLSHSGCSKGTDKKNLFCCLFAPWMQTESIGSSNQSSTSNQEAEQTQAVVASSPIAIEVKSSLEPPASLSEKITASSTPPLKDGGPDTDPPDSDLTPAHSFRSKVLETSNITNLKKTTENGPRTALAAGISPESQSTPHLLSDCSSNSGSVSPASPKSPCFVEEKKEEEGDLQEGDIGIPVSPRSPDEQTQVTPPPIKSILKASRCSVASTDNLSNRNNKKSEEEVALSCPTKRHLFPVYESKNPHLSKANSKQVQFNPMARVLTIPSRKDISPCEKAQVWWQRCDYNEFKKTGRIISKAMECGGSEVWLASSNALGAAKSRKVKENKKNQHTDSVEYNKALSRYVNLKKEDGENSDSDDFGEKWWCKFGHSRRGLEHIACPTEGKARQESVLLAIRKILEEQRHQRAARIKDPNKLRNVALQYTSWARELSFAAGSADAEAVASDFDPSASCRARHFAKWFHDMSKQGDTVGRGVAMAVTSQILDANTHAATPRANKSNPNAFNVANSNKVRTEDLLSKRAQGFLPDAKGAASSETHREFRPLRAAQTSPI